MTSPRSTVPPGPKDHWLLGNLRLSRDNYSQTFARWAREFGPIFEFRLLPNLGLYIVVNDNALAQEMMNREDFAGRGNVLSPFGLIKYPLGQGIVWPDWSDEWKQHRHFLSTAYFDQRRLERAVVTDVDAAVEGMTQTDGALDPQHLLEQVAVNVICRMVFGESSDVREKSSFRDHVISLPRDIFDIGVTPLYVFFPKMIRHYETDLVKRAIVSYDFIVDFIEESLRKREKILNEKEESECLIDAVIIERRRRADASFLSEKSVQHAILDLYFAGVDSLAATLCWTLAWLLRYPDVAKKVEEEIQRVVGSDVSPSPETLKDIDYLRAFVDEVLRRSSAADLSVPHGLLKPSAEFAGFTFTDDKFILINVWSCNHDPKVWDDPEKFSPERFLDEDGKYKRNENMMGFGVGLRRCMGDSQARMVLQVFVARLLLKTDFALAEGTEMPAMKGRKLLVRFPEPYQVTVKAK